MPDMRCVGWVWRGVPPRPGRIFPNWRSFNHSLLSEMPARWDADAVASSSNGLWSPRPCRPGTKDFLASQTTFKTRWSSSSWFIIFTILHTESLKKTRFHPSFAHQVQEIIYQNGETALLPCDISNNNPGDRVTLLLWYKEDLSALSKGMGSPIYRIDARTNKDIKIGQSSVPILDWVNEELLGKNRVSFDTQLSPASLKIRNVSESDAGLYRCRVDFTTSQTRTERLNLRVIMRPSRPRIFDDSGTVRDIFAGPYQEGSEVQQF